MRLLVDLDGTVAHFDREFDRHLKERFSHLTGIPTSDKQISFNLWEGRTPEEQDAIRDIMNHEGFYRHLEVMEGAKEAVAEMQSLGHEVFFVTAPWRENRSCLQDKADWVMEHFGEDAFEQIIFAKKKYMIKGDILFDDKFPIENADQAEWTQVFVHQPYNKDASGLRIHSWDPGEWMWAIEEVARRQAHNTWQNRAWNFWIREGDEVKYS